MKWLLAPLFALQTSAALAGLFQVNFSPDVHPDDSVTFRLFAPDAHSVMVRCPAIDSQAMTQDEHGIWSLTTPPLAPDIYNYSFEVNGFRLLDPANPHIKLNLLYSESELHIPGPPSLIWEVNDVPHGVVHHHFYHSTVAGDDRDFYVYTPPGYDPKATQPYPVLYLLHGYSDDASAWSTVGRANIILDNLIARHLARPMIVVMPLGYGSMDLVQRGFSLEKDLDLWHESLHKFIDALLTEVMPQVDTAYCVSSNRTDHAIAGLSMGGTESLVTGLNHLDQFSYVGSFSAGGLDTNYPAQFPGLDASANAKLNLLWIACGKDDSLYLTNTAFCSWLKTRHLNYSWNESPGAHNFLVWRRNLAAFAPLLFTKP